MIFADWRGRVSCAAITFGIEWLRSTFYVTENTLESVALSCCLSAICNACAIIAAHELTTGRTSFDLQRLAFCALVINYLVFIAYWAKSSPVIHACNTLISVLSYAQLARFLWPNDGNSIPRSRCDGVFRSADFPREGVHLETQK
jgi:hypothetical protein